jgi:hypothetical protein
MQTNPKPEKTMNLAHMLTRGKIVTIRNENDKRIKVKVLGYGQANDGTGRYGYDVETLDGKMIYWRRRKEIKA